MKTDSTLDLFVDDYQIDQLCNTVQSVSAKWKDADAFRIFAGHLGDQVRLHALINRHNSHSLAAYSKADYHLHVMNGDRPAELQALIQRALHQPLPDQLIVISDDPAFLPLYKRAANTKTNVLIFSPMNQPTALLMENGFDVRPLSSLRIGHRSIKKAYGLLDIENVLYPNCSYHRHRSHRSLQPNLKRIETALAQVDNITEVWAFGDFERLANYFGCNVRACLEKRGIKTYQTDNIRGKNSADMEIASAIHVALENDPTITTIVLGSGDRDFRPVVKHARHLGKEVILISQRGALSRRLLQKANQVIYIESDPG